MQCNVTPLCSALVYVPCQRPSLDLVLFSAGSSVGMLNEYMNKNPEPTTNCNLYIQRHANFIPLYAYVYHIFQKPIDKCLPHNQIC